MRTTKRKKPEDIQQLRLVVDLGQREQALLNSFDLGDTDGIAPSVSLTFAAVESGQPVFFSAELTKTAAETFIRSVIAFLSGIRSDVYNYNVDIKDYQASAPLEDHQIEYMNLAQYQDIDSWLAPLRHPKQIPQLHDDINNLDLSYFIISVKRATGTWMHFARTISRGSQPQRSKMGFIFGAESGYLDIVGEPVVFLDPSTIDWMWVGNDLYILDKTKFEEVFEPEDPDAATEKIVRDIAKHLPIANLDAFLASCKRDERMSRKIRSLKGSPHLEMLSIANLKVAKNECGLEIEFGVSSDGKEGLQFTPKFKWQYVKVLAEEYGKSSVTGLPYEYEGHRLIGSPKKKSNRARSRRSVTPPDVAVANS